ncbi:MAG: hypothetical protein AUH30_10595 [Candidatus Rokubacteria bacterium 13_1_40CM_68_15]|nr:MAG: hypothetical protein AUH30_10595 [Candidatus Rokubacteria bacterium 13_1_40CM_68_15]
MRRFLTVVASVFVILVLLAPYADAQQTTAAGPSPKVTINGVIDNVTSWSRNMSLADVNLTRVDKEWYARTRARPDITGELGTTKFVLGLEMDFTWGQSCPNQDSFHRCAIEGTGTPMATFGLRNGISGGADVNTDMPGMIEIKWAYTEFALPWAPAGSIMRLGAQPWTVTHKLAVLATGDFAGLYTSIALTPQIKLNFTYTQIEEQNTGVADGFIRGDDFAIFVSADISPFKGLDLRPIYSFAELMGNTNTSVRQSRGGLASSSAASGGAFPVRGVTTVNAVASAGAAVTPGQPNLTVVPGLGTAIEHRHTVGLDAKWTLGPFYLDPTVLYQWGTRSFVVPTTVQTNNCAVVAGAGGCTALATTASGFRNAGTLQKQDMDGAWLLDVAGGWRAGPLLLEARGAYSTGNKATQDVRDARTNVHFFQPISTDAQFWAGWAEIQALGVDYFNLVTGADGTRSLSPPFAIGYDKYGLKRVGVRASYALTPAFTVRGSVMQSWTDTKVDTNGIKTGSNGIIPSGVGRAAHAGSTNLGTEVDAGITWRFAPGLTFDLGAGYLFTGDAYKAALSQASPALSPLNANGVPVNVFRPETDPKDVTTVAARVRYSF